MFRPPKELTTAPGIRYLELYGLRYVRAYLSMRIMMLVMGLFPIIAAIVLSSFNVLDEVSFIYYIIGGSGGLFLLLGIIFYFVLPNKRDYNRILELRDKGDVTKLKEILYKPGAKSTLAMLALIDLEEISPNMFHRMQMTRGYRSTFDEY